MIKLFMVRLVKHWERLFNDSVVSLSANIVKLDGNTLSYPISLLT